MGYNVDKLREVTMAVRPITEKLKTGETQLTTDEAERMRTACDSWQKYLDSM